MTESTFKRAKRKAKVLVVDDQPLCRFGLAELINREPDLYCGAEARDSRSALETVAGQEVDLAVVEVGLRDRQGLELIKRIKAHQSAIAILVVSGRQEKYYADRCIRAGAMGYVCKDESTDVIMQAIRRVLEGKIYLSDVMTERLLYRRVGHTGEEATELEHLTDRELQVFEMIGMGQSTREIAERLHLSPKTIETYYDRIKKKLAIPSFHQLVPYAVLWGAGLQESAKPTESPTSEGLQGKPLPV